MSAQPVLILIAEPASYRHGVGEAGAWRFFGTLSGMVQRACESGLPVQLVGDEAGCKAVQGMLPSDRILALPFKASSVADQHVEGLVAGVLAQPNAGGWLALPCAMPMLQVGTLREVAKALDAYPVAYAEHHQQQGYPIGFSSELFSELIQIGSFRELERMVVRYPSCRVEVNDPGVLMAPESLRAPLPYLPARRGGEAGLV